MLQIFGNREEGKDLAALGHVAAGPERTMRSGLRRWIGLPSNSMLPFCGSSTPEMVLSTVVLPAPLAPSTVTISPRGTSRLTPRIGHDRPVVALDVADLENGVAAGVGVGHVAQLPR